MNSHQAKCEANKYLTDIKERPVLNELKNFTSSRKKWIGKIQFRNRLPMEWGYIRFPLWWTFLIEPWKFCMAIFTVGDSEKRVLKPRFSTSCHLRFMCSTGSKISTLLANSTLCLHFHEGSSSFTPWWHNLTAALRVTK